MNCPRCATPLEEDDARFCPCCGESLGAPAAGLPAAAPAAPEPEPEPEQHSALPHCARHPERPTRQTCPRCGTFACGECLRVTRAGDPICVGCFERTGGGAEPLPWEQRSERGLATSYFKTTAAVLLSPSETFSRASPATGRWWDPISYALLAGVVAILAYAALAVAALVPDLSKLFEGKLDDATGALAFGVGGLVSLALFGAMLFVGSGLEHLMLMLVGARPRSYEATLRGYCFSFAPVFLVLLPVVGGWIFFVWQIVCRVLAYRGLHETTGGRAVSAVLLPWVACCTFSTLLVGALSSLG